MQLTECRRCGALAAITSEERADFWNARHGLCDPCQTREREPQGETVRLFEPAPNQIPGQTHIAV